MAIEAALQEDGTSCFEPRNCNCIHDAAQVNRGPTQLQTDRALIVARCVCSH